MPHPVRLENSAVLRRHLLRLGEGDPKVAAQALRSLKADPAIAWERFSHTPSERRATERRLGAGFPVTVRRLLEDATRGSAALLYDLASLHGIRPWIERGIERTLGKAARERFRAICFASDHAAYPYQLTVYLTHQCNSRCSYCFALEDMKNDRSYISMENFQKILDWARGQPISCLNLLGGEPTVHPRFSDFMRMAGRQKLLVYFSTNNLYPERVLRAIESARVFNIQVHAMEPEQYHPQQWKTFQRNLGAISTRGIQVWLRYNLYSLDQEKRWHFLFELCERYRLPRINFALTFPVGGGVNRHVALADFSRFAKMTVRFLKECSSRDIEPVITKSFPICYFEPEDQAFVMERCRFQNICTVQRADYTYNIIVRPDLSLDPCIALKWKQGNLLDFRDLTALGTLFRDRIDSLQKAPLFDECETCPIYPLNVCQGTCLAYKDLPA